MHLNDVSVLTLLGAFPEAFHANAHECACCCKAHQKAVAKSAHISRLLLKTLDAAL